MEKSSIISPLKLFPTVTNKLQTTNEINAGLYSNESCTAMSSIIDNYDKNNQWDQIEVEFIFQNNIKMNEVIDHS